jgi:predicted dehydrogenase
MNQPIRTLVVGLGARGQIWSRLLHEEPLTEIVGYVDIDPARLAVVQERWPAEHICFSDLNHALAATQPDLVVLATPPMDRYGEAVAALEHGSHVLSEKPLSLDLDEGVALVRRAEEVERALVVGLNFRYQHVVRYAKQLLASGEIGAPSFARFVYWLNRSGYSPGGNRFPLTMRQPMLYEQSIHHFDEIRFVYGAEVERLWCRCHNPPWSNYADAATVAAEFEMTGDILVSYFGTWQGQTQMNEFSWRTDCTNGALLQREQFSDLTVIRTDEREPTPVLLPGQERLVDDARLMLSDVANQLLAGVVMPEPSGVDHIKTFALVAACEASSASGRPVIMREFYAQHDVPARWLTPPATVFSPSGVDTAQGQIRTQSGANR